MDPPNVDEAVANECPDSVPLLIPINLGSAEVKKVLPKFRKQIGHGLIESYGLGAGSPDAVQKCPTPQDSQLVIPVISLDRSTRPDHFRSASKLRLGKLRVRPFYKRDNSSNSKIVFSVDDAITDEIDVADGIPILEHIKNDKEFLLGYMAALRSLQQNHAKKTGQKYGAQVDLRPVLASDERNVSGIFGQDSSSPRQFGNSALEIQNDVIRRKKQDVHDGWALLHSIDHEDSLVERESISSSSSSNSLGSLNLRERQDAINETHPFGIKIWKPSLYKKNRSVAARAEQDIHDFKAHLPVAHKYWGVTLTNTMWSISIGLVLCVLCWVGAVLVFFCSGFALHRPSRPYVKLLFALGLYWLYPFGKFVLLNKESKYMAEDELFGRLIGEFHQWRLQEEGRLFFAPPRRNTSVNEARPLLKDQYGRLLHDAYSSIDEESAYFSITSDVQEIALSTTQRPQITVTLEDDMDEQQEIKKRFFGRGSWSSGRFAFYIFFYGILQPLLTMILLMCWLGVFTIPMAKLCRSMCSHLRRHPLALTFEFEQDYYRADAEHQPKRLHQLILLCTYRCCGQHYYKYTIDGTNIFFVNLLSAVVFVIFDYYVLKVCLGWNTWYTNSIFMFGACLFSIIPLAYFIGQAVASISAQSSMGVGAVINAFFSTVVEIFLYCVALSQSKSKLVEGSMIGSILGGVLLLPGLSMCGGAINRKTQRYNPRSAGVSSTMLNFAMVIMFAPSVVNQIYGVYEVKCKRLVTGRLENSHLHEACRFVQPQFSLDSMYFEILRPFSAIIAIALFAAYVCGLCFTLKTHASLIWATNLHEFSGPKREERIASSADVSFAQHKVRGIDEPHLPIQAVVDTLSPVDSNFTPRLVDPTVPGRSSHDNANVINSEGGHDAPNWSRNKSVVILLVATIMYAIIAEILVDNVDAVLSKFMMEPKFLGLTVFALVPNTTEFLNAISFAINGNVALSMEIGSAYALQVVLIQIPCLVLYSIYMNCDVVEKLFPLIFPRWDIVVTFTSIYLFTYIYAEGKSNYFKGVILILIYAVALIGFWFNHKIALIDDGYVSSLNMI